MRTGISFGFALGGAALICSTSAGAQNTAQPNPLIAPSVANDAPEQLPVLDTTNIHLIKFWAKGVRVKSPIKGTTLICPFQKETQKQFAVLIYDAEQNGQKSGAYAYGSEYVDTIGGLTVNKKGRFNFDADQLIFYDGTLTAIIANTVTGAIQTAPSASYPAEQDMSAFLLDACKMAKRDKKTKPEPIGFKIPDRPYAIFLNNETHISLSQK